MNAANTAPLAEIYESLHALNTSWGVDIARPSGPGWIAGVDFRMASAGPFNELLERIGERAKTRDKKTIAASFSLRFGYASAMAIAPYLRFGCVPDVSLENVAFKFRESTMFERTAIYEARGVVLAGDSRATHPTMSTVPDNAALVRALRAGLVAQSAPVVDALYEWSGFARRGTWGMLTSSWASQFTALCENRNDQRGVAPLLDALFAGDDVVADMRPKMNAVTYDGATHLYQRRASCCRYYLLPQGDLCASCPLVSDEERLERNREWMKTQLERQGTRSGH